MTKLKYILLLLSILGIGYLHADIPLVLAPNGAQRTLPVVKLEEKDYVSLDEINARLCSIYKVEYSEYTDFRVMFFFYGEQFIFLLNSPFYTFKQSVFNMQYPLLQVGANYYVPTTFIMDNLPLHFPGQIQNKKGTLYLPQPKDKSVKRIVIDPGHGGKDPGAVGPNGTRESMINLNVALRLKHLLEQELGLEVLMTRTDDRFVSLGDRTKFANDNKADLFISIHTNASRTNGAQGIETYYLSTKSTTESRAVEALENSVVELYEGAGAKQKYEALDFILMDMLQTEHLEHSNDLATLVQHNLVAGVQAKNRGVKQANFYVLRGAFMPAILIEMGFISNPEEEALLANPQYQDRLAQAIFESIKRFKYDYDRIRLTS
jgi:N-acetylmuramoyl-L-alanine amidase